MDATAASKAHPSQNGGKTVLEAVRLHCRGGDTATNAGGGSARDVAAARGDTGRSAVSEQGLLRALSRMNDLTPFHVPRLIVCTGNVALLRCSVTVTVDEAASRHELEGGPCPGSDRHNAAAVVRHDVFVKIALLSQPSTRPMRQEGLVEPALSVDAAAGDSEGQRARPDAPSPGSATAQSAPRRCVQHPNVAPVLARFECRLGESPAIAAALPEDSELKRKLRAHRAHCVLAVVMPCYRFAFAPFASRQSDVTQEGAWPGGNAAHSAQWMLPVRCLLDVAAGAAHLWRDHQPVTQLNPDSIGFASDGRALVPAMDDAALPCPETLPFGGRNQLKRPGRTRGATSVEATRRKDGRDQEGWHATLALGELLIAISERLIECASTPASPTESSLTARAPEAVAQLLVERGVPRRMALVLLKMVAREVSERPADPAQAYRELLTAAVTEAVTGYASSFVPTSTTTWTTMECENMLRGRGGCGVGDASGLENGAATARRVSDVCLAVLLDDDVGTPGDSERELARAVMAVLQGEEVGSLLAVNSSAIQLGAATAAGLLAQCFCRRQQRPRAGAESPVGPTAARGQRAVKDFCEATAELRASDSESSAPLVASLHQLAAQQGCAAALLHLSWCFENGKNVRADLNQAARWRLRAAVHGSVCAKDRAAQHRVGRRYEHGEGVAASNRQAAAWYRRAALQGWADAQYRLASFFASGIGEEADAVLAAALYLRAAEQRHLEAQFCIGWCFATGQGVGANAGQGASWYRKAAERGHAGAQYQLGQLFRQGAFSCADEVQAAEWYERAAVQGHPDAQFELGNLLDTSAAGAVTDATAMAVTWWRRAAEQGHGLALYTMFLCFMCGHGVEADASEATACRNRLVQAAEQDRADSKFVLAMQYELSTHARVSVTADQAYTWLRQAAEQGLADAQFCLGMRFAREGPDKAQAVSWYRLAAEQRHAAAQRSLGACYLDGKGVMADASQAVTWLRRAALQGDTDALFRMGECFACGIGVQADAAEAASWFWRAAGRGHAAAQNCLGMCYQLGDGVPMDCRQAAVWYHHAAEQGNADALNNLALCFELGHGVAEDLQQAVALYRLAAEHDHADALNNLGLCYELGRGVVADAVPAVGLYERAAQQGNAAAQYNLGLCFLHGKGVRADAARAVALFRQAAEQGDADAQCHLGWCYEHGEGVQADPAEALAWYMRAAAQGNAEGSSCVGSCYERGMGVPVDAAQAETWRRRAAERQNCLGMCYQLGDGVLQDLEQAVACYLQAVLHGSADALNNLALCFELGHGVAEDLQQAVALYRLAAEHDHADALNNLGLCYELGRGVVADAVPAVGLYERAAQQGNAAAQYNLGLCFLHGKGMRADAARAVALFRQAAEQGDADAQCHLGWCYEHGEGVQADSAEALAWYMRAAAQGNAEARGRSLSLNGKRRW